MYQIQKSALFKRQLLVFAKHYKDDVYAGESVALRFIDEVENAVTFISKKPLACAVYTEARKDPQLQMYEFRKWKLNKFPHSIFFRIENQTIYIEAIYAHKMEVKKRLNLDIH